MDFFSNLAWCFDNLHYLFPLSLSYGGFSQIWKHLFWQMNRKTKDKCLGLAVLLHKLRFSPDCQGQPHAQASCWCPCGSAGCSRCCQSLRSHPPRCWGRRSTGTMSMWTFRGCAANVVISRHRPVAEVVLIVSGDQRHGELVSPIRIKHIKLLRSWRSHFVGARAWGQRTWKHTDRRVFLVFFFTLFLIVHT